MKTTKLIFALLSAAAILAQPVLAQTVAPAATTGTATGTATGTTAASAGAATGTAATTGVATGTAAALCQLDAADRKDATQERWQKVGNILLSGRQPLCY